MIIWDVLDNDFTLFWRAGTAEVGAAPATMNPVVLLEQNPSPTPVEVLERSERCLKETS